MVSGLVFKGKWNAYSNIATLTNNVNVVNALQDGVGTLGDAYIVYALNNATSYNIWDRNLGSGSKSWVALSYVYYDGSEWNPLEYSGGGGGAGTVTNIATIFPVLGGPITTNGTISLAYSEDPDPDTVAFRDNNANFFSNNNIENVTATASTGGTTNLTIASTKLQRLTGTLTHTFNLPNATTLPVGISYEFDNNSTSQLDVDNFIGSLVHTTRQGGYFRVILDNNSTPAGVWDVHSTIPANGQWTTAGASIIGDLSVTGAINSATWSGAIIGVAKGGTSADLSATGGTGQYLKQSSVGAAVTVGTIASSDVSAAGSTTQIQFNNSGSFGGATNSSIIDGNINLKALSAIPAAQPLSVSLYNLTRNMGRIATIDQDSRIIDYGTYSGNKIISKITPSANNTLIGEGNWNTGVLQILVASTAPTAENRTYDATNLAPNFFVTRCRAAANGANGFSGLRLGTPSRAGIQWMPGRSGAFFQATISFRNWNTVSRFMIGYQSLTSTPSASARIDSYLNLAALGKDTDNTNMQWMVNGTSGTATKQDTGIVPNVNNVYRVSIYIPPACGSVYFTLEELTYTTTTVVSTHTATTNLPPAGQQSYFMVHMNNGTGGGTIPSMELILVYEELYTM